MSVTRHTTLDDSDGQAEGSKARHQQYSDDRATAVRTCREVLFGDCVGPEGAGTSPGPPNWPELGGERGQRPKALQGAK